APAGTDTPGRCIVGALSVNDHRATVAPSAEANLSPVPGEKAISAGASTPGSVSRIASSTPGSHVARSNPLLVPTAVRRSSETARLAASLSMRVVFAPHTLLLPSVPGASPWSNCSKDDRATPPNLVYPKQFPLGEAADT